MSREGAPFLPLSLMWLRENFLHWTFIPSCHLLKKKKKAMVLPLLFFLSNFLSTSPLFAYAQRVGERESVILLIYLVRGEHHQSW